jgi:hypothetical protein
MKRLVVILFSLLLLASQKDVQGQNTGESIKNLFGRLISSDNDAERISANDSIITFIRSYVRSDSIFNHSLDIRNLGQITSSDSTLKIVSWNLLLDDYKGKYFTYLIKKSPDEGSNIIFELSSPYSIDSIKTMNTYEPGNWYGALYYDIKPVKSGNSSYYLVLGLNLSNPEVTRKIIDVLDFGTGNSLVLGRKCFEKEDKIKYREVFEFSSEGMMSLRFTSENSIVFDHLVPFSPDLKGDPKFYGPDYSYDAYQLDGSNWRFSLNVDARNEE